MKTGRLAFVAALLAALGAYYYYGEVRRETRKQEAEEKATRLLDLPQDEFKAFTFSGGRAKEGVKLEKEGEQWWITQPLRTPATRTLAEGMVSALRFTTSSSSFDAAADKLGEYGLKDPELRVAVQLASGVKTLLFGSEAPIGGMSYAKWEDAGQVVLIGGQVKDAFDKDVDALRESLVFEFPVHEVEKVTLKTAGSVTWELERSQDPAWKASEPAVVVDPEKVDSFLFNLTHLRAAKFLDDSDLRTAAFGLVPPGREILVKLKQNDRPKRLWLGKAQPDGSVHGWAEPPFPVFLISRDGTGPIEKTLSDFRDLHVARFDRDAAVKLLVEQATVAKTFVRKDKDWVEEGAAGAAAKTFEVEEVLSALREVELERELVAADFQTARGAEEPFFRVSVTTDPQGGPGQEWIFFSRDAGGFVQDQRASRYAQVRAAQVKDLELSVKSLLGTS